MKKHFIVSLTVLFGWGLLLSCGDDEIKQTPEPDKPGDVVEEPRPAGVIDGINYVDNQTVTLSLLAPGKESVFVLGDFNNWEVNDNYLMKKDGEHFWLTIEGLTAQKEYIFQYLIDDEIRIGDPYCDKISDPWDDAYISESVYPGMLPYPLTENKGRASVLQTGQAGYNWQTTSYTIPAKEELVIYELLIRDFTEEGTYKAVADKLDYLHQLGVNAIEFMPFNEFEGNISWGYNPCYYFAPDKYYGTKNDLKALIDECHRRGFIVIQDIVLNHAYGTCPLVLMYWDKTNSRPVADNPWFNVTSPNTSYSWGFDFNHESSYTKEFVDRVTSYWLKEYKVDGFRFDFTKGFTNTSGDGGAYDASRIAILKRMADKVWEVNPKAFVILEHFADNSEEKILTSYNNGMLVWGNANYNFNEATMGWLEENKSDFSWASWQRRGYSHPGLVAYMESHDEERLMYKNITWGNVSTDDTYSIKGSVTTSLERNELAAAFFFCLAGPKMIWQFGELGYDISIDYNDRTGEKPVHWEYYDNPNRKALFEVYSKMISLRRQYPVFVSGTETLNLAPATKNMQLEHDGHYITLIGNFDVEEQTIDASFKQSGTWYEFFSGTTLEVGSTTASVTLAPGGYRLYSNRKL